jgi:hypothetical protein
MAENTDPKQRDTVRPPKAAPPVAGEPAAGSPSRTSQVSAGDKPKAPAPPPEKATEKPVK